MISSKISLLLNRKELASIIKSDIKDPRIADEIISITWVKVSPDFEHCKVGVSVYNSNAQKRQEIIKLLKKSSGFIKRRLADNLSLRAVPELVFQLDEGTVYTQEIEDILATLTIPPEEPDDGEDSKYNK